MERLLSIMKKLRDPVSGCPWDVRQNFKSIAPYTIEEAYEVVDAIERGSKDDLRDELGDLLLQVVFHAQMASEEGAFAFNDVVEAVSSKMIRRHPHVFGDNAANTAEAVAQNWDDIKRVERAEKGAQDTSILDDVAAGMPPMLRAEKLTKKASALGFDWPDMSGVLEKLHEEVAEFDEAYQEQDIGHMAEELGDVMFVCMNLARHMKHSPEILLAKANQKFESRFRAVEAQCADEGKDMQRMSVDELEAMWQQVKLAQRAA